MQKLLCALLLAGCQLAYAKPMLKVSVDLNEQTDTHKRSIQVTRTFDLTAKKQFSHQDGSITCTWQVSQHKEQFFIEAKILENKNGIENELAKPCLVVHSGEKGVVKLGSRSKSSTHGLEESNLQITVLVTEE